MSVKSYDKLAINTNIVLDLPCFEGTGLKVHDVSKSRIDMTVTATVVWTQLASGEMVLTYGGDGVHSYLSCSAADSPELDFTNGDFTLLAWIYSLGTASGSDMIMAKNDTNVDGWEFYVTVPTLKTISLRTNQAGSHTGISAIGALTLDAWQLVGVSRTGSTGQFYVNGLSVTTTLGTGLLDPVSSAARKFRIGIQHDEVNNCFEGSMSRHRIWSRALSDSEHKTIFDREKARYGV